MRRIDGSRIRGYKALLVKEQCRLDMRDYLCSQRAINEWNKLENMLKNNVDRYVIRVGYS